MRELHKSDAGGSLILQTVRWSEIKNGLEVITKAKVWPVLNDLLSLDGTLVIWENVLTTHAYLETLAQPTALAEATIWQVHLARVIIGALEVLLRHTHTQIKQNIEIAVEKICAEIWFVPEKFPITQKCHVAWIGLPF